MEQIRLAYEEAAGKWSGCDWPTCFGKTGLDLQDCTAAMAEHLAMESSGIGSSDWMAAARWLAQVELNAEQAEVQGALALAAANAGDVAGALEHAAKACELERETGRPPVGCGGPGWQRLQDALREAAPAPATAPFLPAVQALRHDLEQLMLRLAALEAAAQEEHSGRPWDEQLVLREAAAY
jgi:hypothetical protein